MIFINILGNNIKSKASEICGVEYFICETCDVLLYKSFDDADVLKISANNKNFNQCVLNLTCEEIQINKLLE